MAKVDEGNRTAEIQEARRQEAQRAHKARLYEALMAERGSRITGMQAAMSSYPKTGVLYTDLRVRCLPGPRGDYLAVIKASIEDKPKVAFISGGSPLEALINACAAIEGGSLRWRDEEPYKERS